MYIQEIVIYILIILLRDTKAQWQPHLSEYFRSRSAMYLAEWLWLFGRVLKPIWQSDYDYLAECWSQFGRLIMIIWQSDYDYLAECWSQFNILICILSLMFDNICRFFNLTEIILQLQQLMIALKNCSQRLGNIISHCAE